MSNNPKRHLPQTGQLGRRDAPRDFNPTPQISFENRATDIPTHFLFQINQPSDSVVTIGGDIRDQMVVGRADPENNFVPDVDLGPYHGIDYGVSRQHAHLFKDGGRLYIQDNHSRNKTYLNGKQIEPGHVYPLQDGDHIEFGRMHVYLFFVYRTMAVK